MAEKKAEPKTDETEAEVAQANAELAAAHAEQAAQDAAEAERDLAEATKENPKARLCPNCNGEMVRHGPGNKEGAWHCNQCGACWSPGLREIRAGHPAPNRTEQT